jgi:hypothetical protein
VKNWRTIVFLLIILVGAFLRLYEAGRPLLWIDEITIVGFGDVQRTASDIVGDIYRAAFKGTTGQHMPFQYLLVNFFLHLYQSFGIPSSEFWVRFPFILFGIATLPVIFWAVRKVYDAKIALWTMAFAAVSFFHVYQSRDATGYAPLLFFLSLNMWGLAGFLCDRAAGLRAKVIYGLLVLIGAMGALFTHMTAWLFLIGEGLVLGLSLVLRMILVRPAGKTALWGEFSRFFWPAVLLLISTAPFISLVLRGMENFNSSTDGGPADKLSLPLLAYQMACFGWGREGGRLAGFLLVLGVGLVFSILRKEDRVRSLFVFGLIALPAILFFMFLQRGYFPRYLSIVFLPLMVFVGRGGDVLTSWLARMLRLKGWAQVVPLAAFWILILVWSAVPYRVLFSMNDKLLPLSQVRQWLTTQLPEGGLYVWRNGYNLRDIPQTYPVADRQAAFACYPNAGIPVEVLDWQRRNAQSFFERFPRSVMLADVGDVKEEYWSWMATYFAHQQSFQEHSINRLWRWGLSPHGLSVTASCVYVAYYNDETNILARTAREKTDHVWPVDPGWRYLQVRDGQLFVAPTGNGLLKVHRPTGQAASVSLVLRGVVVQPGSFTVRQIFPDGRQGPVRNVSFSGSGEQELHAGPFELQGVDNYLQVSQFPVDSVNMLIYSFSLSPKEITETQSDKQEMGAVHGK